MQILITHAFFLWNILSGSQREVEAIRFADVPYRYETKYIVIDSINIAYIEAGRGKPLLFLHGVGSDLSQWENNYPYFLERYRVLGIDLPGFGKSDKPQLEYSFEFYANTIIKFLDKLCIGKINLVGHSFGGHLTLYLAIHFPERLSKIIIVDSAGIQQFTDEQKKYILMQYNINKLINVTAEELRFGLKLSFVKWLDVYEETVQRRIALSKSAEYRQYAFAVHKCIRAMLRQNVKNELYKIQLPVLIIWGEKDSLVPVIFGQEAHQLIQNSKLKVIPDSGHFPMIEKAKEFNQSVSNFIGGIE